MWPWIGSNGTQAAFEDDGDVLFVSTHQHPLYPGTGQVHETGRGAGTGTTVNLPMEAGSDDEDYLRVYQAIVAPVVRQFRPELENPTLEDVEPLFRRTMLLKHPWAEVDDIANAVAFLASDEASYITGTTLPVGGGDLG